MTSAEIDQARHYISLLRNGASDSVMCWQLFNDSDSDAGGMKNFHGKLDECLPNLIQSQTSGLGVYVTINPTDGAGRKIENIVGYDWAFADIDGDVIPADFPLKPAFSTRRDGTHGHIYWPIKGCITETHYNQVQRTISMYLGSDDQVVDPSRVARVPGFKHLKDPSNPVSYVIHEADETVEPYSIGEIFEAFKLSDDQQKVLSRWLENNNALLDGSGINDNPIYVEQLKSFTQVAPVAVKGQGRSFQLIAVAGYGFDRGVPLETTTDVLWDLYNPRCEPPWTENERPNFERYCRNAYNHCSNAPGCKTASGAFGGQPDIPEPTGGWEANKKLAIGKQVAAPIPYTDPLIVDKFGWVTKEQAAALKTMVTNKSTVQELAMFFIGSNYPDGALINFESVFYAFNGKHWEVLEDGKIKNEITRCMFNWAFPVSKIKNIAETLANILFVTGLHRSCYMGDKKTKGVTNIVVDNGIIEIRNGNIELKPHTRELFELNALDYPYDPTAECPEFMAFIDSSWPGDVDMCKQVQEMYGLALANDSSFEKIPFMIGKSRSGKGVHARVMTALLGAHNVCNPTLEGLVENHTIHTMSMRKLALIPEANAIHPALKDRVLNRFKAISGGDALEYDRKYKDSGNCSVWPLMVVQSNEMPDFIDSSGAMAHRVWPFIFTKSYIGKEDRGLTDRLINKQSISGILNFALKGYARVSAAGKITTSAQAKLYVSDLEYDMFPLSGFFEECCNLDSTKKVGVQELHDFYNLYAGATGVKAPYTQSKFGKMIQGSKLEVQKIREYREDGKRPYCFSGVEITEWAIAKYQPGGFTPLDKNKVVDLPKTPSVPPTPVVK